MPALDSTTLFTKGTEGVGTEDSWQKPRAASLLDNSVVNPKGYSEVFDNPDISPGGKAAYVAGRLASDVLDDGFRRAVWLSNHPLAQLSLASEYANIASGLAPDYQALAPEFAKAYPKEHLNSQSLDDVHAEAMGLSTSRVLNKGLPLAILRHTPAALATAAMVQASGNFDALNLGQGGRSPGFEAVMATPGNAAQTTSVPLELAARYLFGRTGRLLPWDQFHQERPDVAKSDYLNYKAHQFDGGLFDIGLIKGTGRNLEGEPEYTMMGFRVPLSAAGAAAGAMGGSVLGAKLADEHLAAHFKGDDAMAGLHRPGHRRFAGAALGGVLGAILGRLGTKAVNDGVLQPVFNPAAAAAAAASRGNPNWIPPLPPDAAAAALAAAAGG